MGLVVPLLSDVSGVTGASGAAAMAVGAAPGYGRGARCWGVGRLERRPVPSCRAIPRVVSKGGIAKCQGGAKERGRLAW